VRSPPRHPEWCSSRRPWAADDALSALRSHALGRDAALIGEVDSAADGLVVLETALGGSRIVDMLVGDPLPRIC